MLNQLEVVDSPRPKQASTVFDYDAIAKQLLDLPLGKALKVPSIPGKSQGLIQSSVRTAMRSRGVLVRTHFDDDGSVHVWQHRGVQNELSKSNPTL